MRIRTPRAAALLAVGGALLAAAVIPAGVASALPGDGPLINTTCSYEQLYAAIRVEAPQAAARLDGKPQARAKLQELVSLPVEQRKQRLSQFLAENPGVQQKIDERWNTPEGQQKVQKMARVAETCSGY